MIQGAIVGLGHVALNGHLPAWKQSKNFKICSGVDQVVERQDLFKQAIPSVPVYSNLEECSELYIDFLDIATPPFTHYPIILRALEKGWNVLCEKPLVLKKEELVKIQELCAKNNKVIFTVHNWKFSEQCKAITNLLKSNAIGKLKHVAWQVFRTGPSITTDKENWRLDLEKAGGGILIDHGWHAFYLLQQWIRKNPISVSAQMEKKKFTELNVEDTAHVQIKFGDASKEEMITSEITLTWASNVRKNSALLEGEEGTIMFEDNQIRLIKKSGESKIVQKFNSPLSQGSHHPDWFSEVIQEFETELTNPTQKGKNLKEAATCLEILLAAMESNRTGQEVPIGN